MFRLQVMYDSRWRWGVRDYGTEQEAMERVEHLARCGIKARVKPIAELLG